MKLSLDKRMIKFIAGDDVNPGLVGRLFRDSGSGALGSCVGCALRCDLGVPEAVDGRACELMGSHRVCSPSTTRFKEVPL